MLITGGVSLLTVPALVVLIGPVAWANLAVAQAIGGFFAVFVIFGWGITGPTMIASTPPELRQEVFATSFKARVALLLIALPVAALVIVLVVPSAPIVHVVYAAVPLVTSLGAVWYFVGSSRPRLLLLCDTLPRAAGVLLGLATVSITGSVLSFALFVLFGSAAAVMVSLIVVLRGHKKRGRPRERKFIVPWGALKSQRAAVVTVATTTLYVQAPLVLIAVLLPSATPLYAIADRILRFAIQAFAPVTQVAQGWVGDLDANVARARARKLAAGAAPLGVILGVAFGLLLPSTIALLSAGELEDAGFAFPFGVVFGCIVMTQVVGLAALMALGASRSVAASTLIGAVVGVPLLFLGAQMWGAIGVAWAVAVSELAVVIIQLLNLRKLVDGREVGKKGDF